MIKNNMNHKLLLLLAGLLILSFSGQAQDKKTQPAPSPMQKRIESKRFVFRAQTASPQRGGLIQLTGVGYTLKVSPDTIVCDLPYYGRAYTAPIGTSDVGMKFTSTQFEYAVKPKKKKGWIISIRTQDLSDNVRGTLTVFENGTASLFLSSNNRQSISYNGLVEESK